MRKAILFLTAALAAASLCGCGQKEQTNTSVVGEGKDKSAQTEAAQTAAAATPLSAEAAALPESGETQPPFVESGETTVVTAQEIAVSEKKEEFEQSAEADGFVKYISGDGRWGIMLPADAVAGDEDESGAIFMLGQNMIAVNTMDDPVEMRSVAEAKEYYSVIADVRMNRFTVIYDGNTYTGCCFDFEAPNGEFGFGKYAVKGRNAASAAARNISGDASLNDVLRDTVNSLVVFE